MKFIQVRHSGDVFYFTEELAKRDDIDVIEAPAGSTPDTVRDALNQARDKLAAEAAEAAAEAEKAYAVKVVPQTRKVTKVAKVAAPTVVVETAGGEDDGSGE